MSRGANQHIQNLKMLQASWGLSASTDTRKILAFDKHCYMKCPDCNFVCSDLRDICPKCFIDLRPQKKSIGIAITHPNASYNELVSKQKKKTAPEVIENTSSQPKKNWFSNIFAANKSAEDVPIKAPDLKKTIIVPNPTPPPQMDIPAPQSRADKLEELLAQSELEETPTPKPPPNSMTSFEARNLIRETQKEQRGPEVIDFSAGELTDINSLLDQLGDIEIDIEVIKNDTPPEKKESTSDMEFEFEFEDERPSDQPKPQSSVPATKQLLSHPVTAPEPEKTKPISTETSTSPYISPTPPAGIEIPAEIAVPFASSNDVYAGSVDEGVQSENVQSQDFSVPPMEFEEDVASDTLQTSNTNINDYSSPNLEFDDAVESLPQTSPLHQITPHEPEEPDTVPVDQIFIDALREMDQQDSHGNFELSLSSLGTFERSDQIDILFDLIEDAMLDPTYEDRYIEDVKTTDQVKVESSFLSRQLERVQKIMDTPVLSLKHVGLNRTLRDEDDTLGSRTRKIEYPEIFRVSWIRNVCSLVIDCLSILGLALCLGIPLALWRDPEVFKNLNVILSLHPLLWIQPIGTILSTALGLTIVYPLVCHLVWGKTLGNKMLGLTLIRDNGNRVRMGNVLVRTLTFPLSLLCFGYLPLLLGKRSMHDSIAHTYLGRLPAQEP